MSLVGTSNQTVIDCENSASALQMLNINDVKVEFLNIRRGNSSTTNLDSGGRGGGIFIIGSSFVIANVAVNECISSREGGGIFIVNSQGIISTVRITNNTSWNSGGGIAVFNSSVQLDDLQVDSNIAKESSGGVIIHGGTSFITKSKIINNRASTTGGGMSLQNVNSTRFSRVDISKNVVDNTDHRGSELHGAGGGLYIRGGSFLMNAFTISSNVATNASGSGSGGGIFVHQVYSPSTIFDFLVINNQVKSVGAGAALFCENSNLEMVSTTLASPSPYAVTVNNCVGAQAECECLISSECKSARLLDGPTCTCYFQKGNLANSTCICPTCQNGICNRLSGDCICNNGWMGSACDDPMTSDSSTSNPKKWMEVFVIFACTLGFALLIFGVSVAYLKWRKTYQGYQKIN